MSLTAQGARLLSAQLRAELQRVAREAAELAEVVRVLAGAAPDATQLWAAAGHLQAFYSGIEAILLRVAKEVDGVVPTGPDSHRELLRQGSIALPGVRPAVLDAEVVDALAPYLAFRHFFRHAYGITLRWERMEAKMAGATPTFERFSRAVEEFCAFLDALAG